MLVVLLRVAVPAIALFGEPPTRFGFQMYSAQGAVSVEAFNINGNEIVVDLSRALPGAIRLGLDWTEILPEDVCAVEVEAVRVTVRQSGKERKVSGA